MKCRYVCVMDVGPRSEQEDCILIEQQIYQDQQMTNRASFESNFIIMAVCDGMGGHDAGEEASRFVCEKLNSIVDLVDFSSESIQTIMTVVQNSSSLKLPKGSGTTLAGLAAKKNKIIMFNAGDSRVYRLNNGELSCVSRDHSLVQELLERGMISEDDAFRHPYKNVVNFGIGPAFVKAKNKYAVNTYEEEVVDKTCYLICSDGVSDVLRNKDLQAILGNDPINRAEHLIHILKKIKLKDNVSFIITEISSS